MALNDELPSDVLLEIFSLVGQDQKAPLLNATLASRRWHLLAQFVIDRTIDLTISIPRKACNLKILRRLAKETQLQSRARHLIVRDCHTKQRVPLGLAESPPVNAWANGEYFSDTYVLDDQVEQGIRDQLDAIQQAITAAQLTLFTWAAIPPLPHKLTTTLARNQSISIHVKLNPDAVSTAAWSWTPVANLATLRRLNAISSQITLLELCLPANDERVRPLLHELGALIWACPRLQKLQLHSLGRQSARDNSIWHQFGVNGPTRAQAGDATIDRFGNWRTNNGRVYPNIYLPDLSPNGRGVISFPPSLTTLTLQHFCVCKVEDKSLLDVPQMPALSTLKVTCLLLLKAVKTGATKLQSLAFSCADELEFGPHQQLLSAQSCDCTTFWTTQELSSTLMGIHGLRELEIYGFTDDLDEPAYVHLGKTLRRLTLLGPKPRNYNTGLVNTVNNVDEYRQSHLLKLRDFVSLLRATCPLLAELSLDAPNTSAEFDALLDSINKYLSRLKHLHLRRSLEPYGDTVLPNLLSYARFTTDSVLAVWRMLTKYNPHLELKMTIGEAVPWDVFSFGSSISPQARSRTFTVVRADDLGDELSKLRDYCITLHEKMETDKALADGRPGALGGFWKAQAEIVSEYFVERNIPVKRQALLKDGMESNWRSRRPDAATRQDPAYRERQQQAFQPFTDALQAQHDAEVEEAANPTRPFY